MLISDQIFSGERPLYESRDVELRNVTIGEGESGLKESRGIKAAQCCFEGKYALWECADVECRDCHFAASDRAPVWYSRNLRFEDCFFEAPKAFREVNGLTIERIKMTDGIESFWHCRGGQLSDVEMHNAEYAFLHSEQFRISNLRLQGKYAFQYARDIEIRNAVLDTKDAFWNSENITVYDAELRSEYLGWYSRNLRLVRCLISGTQPLCYCENLILEDCTFAPDADRALERSTYKMC